jgi:putative transposase
VLRIPRSSHRYQSVRDERAALRIRLRDLATTRVRYGYRRLTVLLRREGWPVNHKLVYRLSVEEGLQMRRRSPKLRKSCAIRMDRPVAQRTNECWSMDFMAEQLFQGQRFRILTLVDHFSRESLALRVAQRFRGDDVVQVLESVMTERGLPRTIRVDNGPEFISKSLDWWAYFKGLKLDFSRPGKPTDNAFIESFNGKFRQECLNQHWFLSLDDAQEVIEGWRDDYNQQRPHSALGDRPPAEFANFQGGMPPLKNLVSLAFQVDQTWGQGHVFADHEWKPVWRIVTKQPLRKTPPTLSAFIKLLPQLGGYNNRSKERAPGPLPLGIGVRRLLDYSTAWLTFGPDAK